MPTETLDIIELEDGHVPAALRLSQEAHWNQVEADWRMMMKAGDAIGIEAPDGRLIATALSLPYGDEFGWISMVLVTEDWQKRGLATRLLQACIENLESRGLTPVLDATPAGENVYRPLGFLPHFVFQRWEHDAVEKIDIQSSLREGYETAEMATVSARDRAVFGGERPAVLESLIARSREFSCIDRPSDGFLLGREGCVASQIGPISAEREEVAIGMLDHALARMTGRVFIDVSDRQTAVIDRLTTAGFCPQRPFLRMAKGRSEPIGVPSRMFAMAGPELG